MSLQRLIEITQDASKQIEHVQGIVTSINDKLVPPQAQHTVAPAATPAPAAPAAPKPTRLIQLMDYELGLLGKRLSGLQKQVSGLDKKL